MLHSDLFQSKIAVCVRPALPYKGVILILGNGATGGHVWDWASPPPVVSSIVRTMTQFISLLGIPTLFKPTRDQTSPLTGLLQVLVQLCLKHNKASSYHAESQESLECFHQSLKMLMLLCADG